MRIRPPLQHGVPSWSKENCIHAVSGSTVAIAPPENSQGYRNGDRGQTYNFTRVFNEHTGQEEYFQSTAAPLVSLCHQSAVRSSIISMLAQVQYKATLEHHFETTGACFIAERALCAVAMHLYAGQAACSSAYLCHKCSHQSLSVVLMPHDNCHHWVSVFFSGRPKANPGFACMY